MAVRIPLSRILLCAVVATQLAACAAGPRPGQAERVEFDIPYLTTRAVELNGSGQARYSTDVADTSAGACTLTHEVGGELDPKVEGYRTEPIDDVLSSVDAGNEDGLLVYIHGYNVGLKRACREAAKVAFRAGFEGRVLLFSWPASRAVLTYRKDKRRLAESMPAITESIGALAERFGAGKVNILAHSLGTTAIASGEQASAIGNYALGDLILIAPDIDREAFVETVPTLEERFRDISVLASDADHVLLLSQTINFAPRLGRSTDLEVAGVEVIDVTGLGDHGFGNHLYHLRSDEVGDLLRVILAD